MILEFRSGTLTLSGGGRELPPELERRLTFDPRTGDYRARACDYAGIYLALQCSGLEFTDRARAFSPIELEDPGIRLRPHQVKALAAWQAAGYRGVAALPTGSGKTILAVAAIHKLRRPTLVLVPTIDLLTQWTQTLERFFYHQRNLDYPYNPFTESHK